MDKVLSKEEKPEPESNVFEGNKSIFWAFEHLLLSDSFSKIAKQKSKDGGKYRMYKHRFDNGDLQTGAMVDLLVKHKYKISITIPF